MTTKVRSNKGSKSPDPLEGASVEGTPMPSDVGSATSIEPVPSSAELAPRESLAPSSMDAPESHAATSSIAPSSSLSGPPKAKKKKKKTGTRKSKAPGPNGTLELTPSTAAPPVVATAVAASAKADIDPDDISVPPAEDLDHDFFSAPVAPPSMSRASYEPVHEIETRDPRIAALMTSEVKRRRAHFAKYVKAAVAISLVLCLAAVVRVGIRRNHGDDSTAMAATSVRPTPVVVIPDPPTAQKPIDPPPPALEDTVAAEPAIDPPPAVDPAAAPATSASAEPAPSASAAPVASASAAPSAEPAPSASAAPVAATEPTELDPKAAGKEKRLSQRALDQGKIKDAIEHGEQSVKLDPTDAEAWLLLGAAYQMKGDHKEARRCFSSCIKEGKRGPKGECMAMPH